MDADVIDTPQPVDRDPRLVNPVWWSLVGPHARWAVVEGAARRYRPDVSVWGAVGDEATPADFDDLAPLLGPQGTVILFRSGLELPPAWVEEYAGDGLQMVATSVVGAPAAETLSGIEGADGLEVVELGPDDADDMVELVARTEPGPFEARTHELGRYLGVRDARRSDEAVGRGPLVAMAGERMRLDGYCEISAVCTDEAYRGRGLAAALVRDIVLGIEGRGDVAILHAAVANPDAIRLYRRLGFEPNRIMRFAVVRPAP